MLVEKPWHAFRIAALHRIAKFWDEEQQYFKQHAEARIKNLEMPTVDEEARHERIRTISVGIYPKEPYVGEPVHIDWDTFGARLEDMGLEVEPSEARDKD